VEDVVEDVVHFAEEANKNKLQLLGPKPKEVV
jgi:hypothetical protein